MTGRAYPTSPEPELNAGVMYVFSPATSRSDADYRLVDEHGDELGVGVQDARPSAGVMAIYRFETNPAAPHVQIVDFALSPLEALAKARALLERPAAVLQ